MNGAAALPTNPWIDWWTAISLGRETARVVVLNLWYNCQSELARTWLSHSRSSTMHSYKSDQASGFSDSLLKEW